MYEVITIVNHHIVYQQHCVVHYNTERQQSSVLDLFAHLKDEMSNLESSDDDLAGLVRP